MNERLKHFCILNLVLCDDISIHFYLFGGGAQVCTFIVFDIDRDFPSKN